MDIDSLIVIFRLRRPVPVKLVTIVTSPNPYQLAGRLDVFVWRPEICPAASFQEQWFKRCVRHNHCASFNRLSDSTEKCGGQGTGSSTTGAPAIACQLDQNAPDIYATITLEPHNIPSNHHNVGTTGKAVLLPGDIMSDNQ